MDNLRCVKSGLYAMKRVQIYHSSLENRSFHLPVCPHLGLKNSEIECSRTDKGRVINDKLHQFHNACMRRRSESDWHAEFLLKEFTLIEDGKSYALRCPGKRTYDSCLHCLTDFVVMVSSDKRKVIIQGWHNFGTEGSPMDPC